MSASASSRPAAAMPGVFGHIRPRPRWLELRLLLLASVVLVVGSASLGATVRGRPGDGANLIDLSLWMPLDALALAIYLGALFAAHLAFVVTGRRTDQVLLPAVGMLGGISLLLMERLPQDLVGRGSSAPRGSARSSSSGCSCRWPSRRRSQSSSARIAGSDGTNTPGPRPASRSCC